MPAYATPDELAAELRVQVTAKNSAQLQSCVDAASREIDLAIDFDPAGSGLDPLDLPVVHQVCLARGLEWFKANDSAFGAIGFDGTGVLAAPRDGFARWAVVIQAGIQQRFGIG